MPEFKIGDRVMVNIKDSHNRSEGIDKIVTGEIIFITNHDTAQIRVRHKDLLGAWGSATPFHLKKGEGGWWYLKDIKSTDVIKEAIETLTFAGYTITPPPEPLKGIVVVYKNTQEEIFSVSKERWDLYEVYRHCTPIAVVPWTEGDDI